MKRARLHRLPTGPSSALNQIALAIVRASFTALEANDARIPVLRESIERACPNRLALDRLFDIEAREGAWLGYAATLMGLCKARAAEIFSSARDDHRTLVLAATFIAGMCAHDPDLVQTLFGPPRIIAPDVEAPGPGPAPQGTHENDLARSAKGSGAGAEAAEAPSTPGGLPPTLDDAIDELTRPA